MSSEINDCPGNQNAASNREIGLYAGDVSRHPAQADGRFAGQ
jgi:hypothetical protein